MNSPPNFDPLARVYRGLEYLTLGPLLQRARTGHLAAVLFIRQALILGDGDGRFTAELMRVNPNVRVEAVDASAAMLAALRRRCPAGNLTTTQEDLRTFMPKQRPDLIVTHFVLDCLTQEETDALVARLSLDLVPGGLWLVSDFRIPQGWLRRPAQLYLWTLYLAFRLLTGLRVTHLPDHAAPMLRAGLGLVRERRLMAGLLFTQVWEKQRSTTDPADGHGSSGAACGHPTYPG